MLTEFQKLATALRDALEKRSWQLVTAESCTGGLIAAVITSISGSSTVFDRGFVTYSNAAKAEMLGVPSEILTKFGAVSEQTAQAMANGAIANSHAQVSLSVTGIAGPTGGTPEKPVGTVCFAWHIAGKIVSDTQCFSGDRKEIREQAVKHALMRLLEELKK